MTDTAAHDADNDARSVFAGLVPTLHPHEVARDRSRIGRGAFATVPILLVGSLAAMTLNLTGPAESADAKPLKPRGATSEIGTTIRNAVAAASTALKTSAAVIDAPTTYRVTTGDTISDIAGRYGLSTASVLALNGLGWSSLIFPGQELKLTSNGTVPELAVVAPDAPLSNRYTIVSGDTISGIADRFGVSTLSLLSANGLGWASIIYPGQTIAIPGTLGAPVEPDARARDSDAEPIAFVQPVAEPESLVEPVVEAPVAEAAPVSNGSYLIVSGDTLSGIAAKFGISTQALLDANGMTWESLIFGGDTLVIPGVATTASSGASSTILNEDMAYNASVIIGVGRELGVPDYGIIIALATAMQESSMRNLDWGDRDSVGLFQQRPSSGWGSVEQLTNQTYASRLFYGGASNPNAGYTRGLLDISGWESMSLTEAAQRVQISAYPDAYAKWEESARSWFAELG